MENRDLKSDERIEKIAKLEKQLEDELTIAKKSQDYSKANPLFNEFLNLMSNVSKDNLEVIKIKDKLDTLAKLAGPQGATLLDTLESAPPGKTPKSVIFERKKPS